MPCKEEQFKKELKPILVFLGENLEEFDLWSECEIIVTNLANKEGNGGSSYIDTAEDKNRQYYPKFCAQTFIEALGYDYEAVVKAMQPRVNTGLNTEQFKSLADSVVNKQTHYKIIKPIPFFTVGDVVHKETLKKYYTKKFIKKLIGKKYIS